MCLNYDTPAFYINDSEVVSNISIETGQWYHIVGTYDGSDLKIYVNGYPAGEESVTDEYGVKTPAFIGSDGGYSFDGLIDDVHVYNYALDRLMIWSLGGFETTSVFTVKNSLSEDVVTIDDEGNLFLTGYLTEYGTPIATANDEFIIMYQNYKMSVTDCSTGNMTIAGCLTEDYDDFNTLLQAGYQEFVIINENEEVVALFDHWGNLFLSGYVFEEGN